MLSVKVFSRANFPSSNLPAMRAGYLSTLQFKQFKTSDFSRAIGSAFIARNEKVEAKSRISQKETHPRSKREASSRSQSAAGSRIRKGREDREILRWKSPTVAVALRGSGKTGRIDAARTVSGNVAILSGDVAFDPRLFSRQLSRRPRKHAGRDHRGHHLRRGSARCDS